MKSRATGIAVASFALLAALIPNVTASAQTNAEENTLCTIAGAVDPTPAITFVPTPGKYTLEGTMDCASGRKGTGKVTGKGAGTIGCSGGKNEATLNVKWKDGDTSTLAVSLADFAYGSGGVGKVTEGALQGSNVGISWARAAAAAEAKCAAGGVESYQFAGGVAFTN